MTAVSLSHSFAQVTAENESGRSIEGPGRLIPVIRLVARIARRHREHEQDATTLRGQPLGETIDQRVADTVAPAVGTDRHPRDLRRFVEAFLVGEESHDVAVLDRDETGGATDGGGTRASALRDPEVVREPGDDRVARLRVGGSERSDLDRTHPPRTAATRLRAMRSAAAAVEIPSRSAVS